MGIRFTVATLIWLAVTEYLCHNWPRVCSLCRNHNLVLRHSRLIIGFVARATRRVPQMEQQLLTLPVFIGVRVARSLDFYIVFCRLLFVLFFWSLYCLSFFDLRLLITPLVTSWNEQFTDINCLREKQDMIQVIRFSCNLIARWIIAMKRSILHFFFFKYVYKYLN